MYLLSLNEETNVVEASLGGKIDAHEMKVLGEEIAELLDMLNTENFYVLLDYSKAKPFEPSAQVKLDWIKDTLLDCGAQKIVNVARDDEQLVANTTSRIQCVLEGKEEFLLDAAYATFPAVAAFQRSSVLTDVLQAA